MTPPKVRTFADVQRALDQVYASLYSASDTIIRMNVFRSMPAAGVRDYTLGSVVREPTQNTLIREDTSMIAASSYTIPTGVTVTVETDGELRVI